MLPTLLPAADAIPIEAAAATDELAAIYQAELPGLTDRGAGRIGRGHLKFHEMLTLT